MPAKIPHTVFGVGIAVREILPRMMLMSPPFCLLAATIKLQGFSEQNGDFMKHGSFGFR
jgi:hypothetical protein